MRTRTRGLDGGTLLLTLVLVFALQSVSTGVSHSQDVIEKTAFLPEGLATSGQRDKQIKDMGIYPTKNIEPEFALLSNIVTQEFVRYMQFYLKPEYIPDQKVIEKNLVLVRALHTLSNRDAAYLKYRIGNRDAMVSQTGEHDGSICISFSLNDQEKKQCETLFGATDLLKEITNQHFVDDPHSQFKLDLKATETKDVYRITPESYRINYRRSLHCIVSHEGICMFFPSKHPSPPHPDAGLPKVAPPQDKWFDFLIARHKHLIEMEEARKNR